MRICTSQRGFSVASHCASRTLVSTYSTTLQAQYTIPCTAHNTELTGSTSITRKASQTVPNADNYTVFNSSQRLHFCDIIYSGYRKEHRSNGRYGRIYHTRRDCQNPQKVRGHRYPVASTRQDTRIQSRRDLGSKQERLRVLDGPTKQLYQTREQAEINKATKWWQTTTNDLVAFRLASTSRKLPDDNPWNSLPVFSIHRSLLFCKVLCSERVRVERCVYP